MIKSNRFKVTTTLPLTGGTMAESTSSNIARWMAFLLFSLLLSLPASVHADEEVLRLLVWEGYAPEQYIENFENEIEKKYGRKVKLKVSYAESPDNFFDSIRNNSVDLVTISHHTIKDERFNFIDKRMILPFDLKNIPNHVNVIPELKRADFHLSDGKIYGVPVANGPYGLAYNTKMFDKAPQSWSVFWDPAYKDKYVLGAHEYIYNANIAAMVLGYPRNLISSYDALNNKKFRKKLRQLAVNAHSLWVGVDKPDDLSGMSVAASWGDSISSLRRRGEMWKMATPKEGTIWWVDEYALTSALANKPFLKKVAEAWINASLSQKFQVDHLVREVGIFPVTTNIADSLTAKEKERLQIDAPGSFMDKHILQTTYSQRDRNGLQILWEEAMIGISNKKE